MMLRGLWRWLVGPSAAEMRVEERLLVAPTPKPDPFAEYERRRRAKLKAAARRAAGLEMG